MADGLPPLPQRLQASRFLAARDREVEEYNRRAVNISYIESLKLTLCCEWVLTRMLSRDALLSIGEWRMNIKKYGFRWSEVRCRCRRKR